MWQCLYNVCLSLLSSVFNLYSKKTCDHQFGNFLNEQPSRPIKGLLETGILTIMACGSHCQYKILASFHQNLLFYTIKWNIVHPLSTGLGSYWADIVLSDPGVTNNLVRYITYCRIYVQQNEMNLQRVYNISMQWCGWLYQAILLLLGERRKRWPDLTSTWFLFKSYSRGGGNKYVLKRWGEGGELDQPVNYTQGGGWVGGLWGSMGALWDMKAAGAVDLLLQCTLGTQKGRDKNTHTQTDKLTMGREGTKEKKT